MPTKYDPETRLKTVRLVVDHRAEYASEWAAIKATAGRLGMTPETLRKWVRQTEINVGTRDGIAAEAAQEIRELKHRNKELEETVEILKTATSFFVRESDPRSR